MLLALCNLVARGLNRCDLARWLFLTTPALLFFALRYYVVGSLLGGYTKLQALQGEAASQDVASWFARGGRVLVELLAPGPGAVDLLREGWAHAALALALMLVLLVFMSGAWRRLAFWGLILFAALNFGPLLWADSLLQGGSSQRWHTTFWAISALLCLGVKMPGKAGKMTCCLVMVLAALNTRRLLENRRDYDDSAQLLNNLRLTVNEAAEEMVFVYNVMPYVGCAPFFEIGLGQTSLPPFGSGKKMVYPIVATNAHGDDPRLTQTPIVGFLHAKETLLTALWLDYDSMDVFDFPIEDLEDSAKRYASLPRFQSFSPKESPPLGTQLLEIEAGVLGIDRIDIHLLAPLVELRYSRFRGRGRFAADAVSYYEDLSPLLEIATHLDGAADGRCWLWVVGYQVVGGRRHMVRTSDFIEMELSKKRR